MMNRWRYICPLGDRNLCHCPYTSLKFKKYSSFLYRYTERVRVLTLWRVPIYNLPGLPRPTMSQGCSLGFFASTSTSVAAAVEVELAVMVIKLAEVEDEGSCIMLISFSLLQIKMRYWGLIDEV